MGAMGAMEGAVEQERERAGEPAVEGVVIGAMGGAVEQERERAGEPAV